MDRKCSGCSDSRPRSSFSRNQWLKGEGRSRCKDCVAGSSPSQSKRTGAPRLPSAPAAASTKMSLTQSLSSLSLAEASGEDLFEQPPPREDCAVCLLRLPGITDQTYHECCGKFLCSGCVVADLDVNGTPPFPCAFCRTPGATSEEVVWRRMKKRMEAGDSMAFHQAGCFHNEGIMGRSQNNRKALEHWLRAVEIGPPESLGTTRAHCSIAEAYEHGEGVGKDMKRAVHHYCCSAMGGNEQARFNLGAFYCNRGNFKLGMKHLMVSAKAGDDDSMKEVQQGLLRGHVAENEYVGTMQAYKVSKDEMRSEQRVTAAMRQAMRAGGY